MEMRVSEIEAKFYVARLDGLRHRIIQFGGLLSTPRHLEKNYRLDTPQGQLAAQRQVLRVRQGHGASLTLKQPGSSPEIRQEIELEIDDAERGLALLERLGYQVVVRYEKYREVFRLGQIMIMLDELPFGDFLEIEGENLEALQAAAQRLELVWERRLRLNYLELFDLLRRRYDPSPEAATFEAFQTLPRLDGRQAGLTDARAHLEEM
jgi:adenylate cyclase, class 2